MGYLLHYIFLWVGISGGPKYHFFPPDSEPFWAYGQAGNERKGGRERSVIQCKHAYMQHYIKYINPFTIGTHGHHVLNGLCLFNMHLHEP